MGASPPRRHSIYRGLPQNSIVFVHGLNPRADHEHARRTWTSKRVGTFWPEHMMPVLVPTARIILFAYNSSFVVNTTNAKVGDHALSLLEGLQSQRRTEVRC